MASTPPKKGGKQNAEAPAARPKAWYKASDGTKVEMKGAVNVGDTIGGRKVADFEDDGRIIFAKQTPPTAPAAPAAAAYDVGGRVRIHAASVLRGEDSELDIVEGDTKTILKKLADYTDARYADRNVQIGLDIEGPAPRIVAALAALSEPRVTK